MKIKRLTSALESLIDEKKIINNDLYSVSEYDELTNIIVEALESVYQQVSMKEIETKVTQGMKIDIESLEKGLKTVEDARPIPFDLQQKDKIIHIDPTNIIRELKDFIEKIKARTIDRINALLGLELFQDSNFNHLMMAFDSTNQIFSSMQSLLRNKLENINNDDILLLWARIKSSFSNDEQNRGFPIYDNIIPQDFFNSKNSELDVRDKCAIVIAKYRPLTIKKMVEEGIDNIPIITPGISRILTNTSDLSQITSLEILLIRSMSQIIALHNLITHKNSSDIARAIRADQYGLIFNGEFLKEYRKSITDRDSTNRNIDKNKLLILNLKRLVEYTALFTKQQTQIENILRQYKMGQEIISPRRKAEFDNVHNTLEIYLQKDICKFLLERNILAFGKSIGRNQIDLYYKEISGDDFVIEAKIYKNENHITLNALKKNIVQLQSYMDLHVQPKGILAIYNFTNALMMAPRKWLRGRIFILCINLCDSTASTRKSSIEIVESETNIIELIEVSKTSREK